MLMYLKPLKGRRTQTFRAAEVISMFIGGVGDETRNRRLI